MHIPTIGSKFICDTFGNCLQDLSNQVCPIANTTSEIVHNLGTCAIKAISQILQQPTCQPIEALYIDHPSISTLDLDQSNHTALMIITATAITTLCFIALCFNRSLDAKPA